MILSFKLEIYAFSVISATGPCDRNPGYGLPHSMPALWIIRAPFKKLS